MVVDNTQDNLNVHSNLQVLCIDLNNKKLLIIDIIRLTIKIDIYDMKVM